MFHLRNQVFQHRIGHIADEQIALVVPRGQKIFIRIRGFRYHPRIFGVSGTVSSRFGVSGTGLDSGFQVPNFGVSGALDSGFQVPIFGVSGTGVGKSASAARRLEQVVHCVTLLTQTLTLLTPASKQTGFITGGKKARREGKEESGCAF